VIWIETLSRHKEPVARIRAAGDATIGRAYDNDIIVDDPHVAPRHIRIRRNDGGALIAEDLDTQNGLYDETGKRQQTLELGGNTLFRIGKTWLRVRESSFEVAAERQLLPEARLWLWLLGLLTLASALGLLSIWLADSSEYPDKFPQYLAALLTFVLPISLWVGFWALLTRLFQGHTRVISHAIIAVSWLLAVLMAPFLQNWLSFAFSSRAVIDYGFIFVWILCAIVCFAHLRTISTRHLALKAGIVSALALCICLAEWLGTSPFSPDEASDNGSYLKQMFPPSWRMVTPRTETEFLQEVQNIKIKLDELREKETGKD
jgi:hypothetical protein